MIWVCEKTVSSNFLEEHQSYLGILLCSWMKVKEICCRHKEKAVSIVRSHIGVFVFVLFSCCLEQFIIRECSSAFGLSCAKAHQPVTEHNVSGQGLWSVVTSHCFGVLELAVYLSVHKNWSQCYPTVS
jgi:hypothetical protein